MVWGIASPSSFGVFFPRGDYIGWREGLLAYFENEMPAERKALFDNALSYPYYVVNKFAKEPDKEGSSEQPPFSPVEPHEAPKRFTLRKKYSQLGSLIETRGQILAVDEPLKDIIERFEPEMHRFFPIEITMPGNEARAVQRSLLKVIASIDLSPPKAAARRSFKMENSNTCGDW
jgi:hypothetical protein